MKYLTAFAIWFFSLSLGLAQSEQQGLPKVICGKLVRLENFPSTFVDARNVDVWLPEGYNEKQKYPVLYMHDGQMLFDSSKSWNQQEWGVDEVLCGLIAKGQILECIVVGIWNNKEKRAAEYFPQKAIEVLSPEAKKVLTPRTNDQPLADNYLKFIVLEVKPTIDQFFSTLADQKNTFISGSSMGGLISMYAICEYPKVFGGAACLSTHWPGIFTNDNNPVPDALLKYMKQNLPSPKNHKIYFDHGTATLDSLYGVWQTKVDVVMKEKKYGTKNWTTKVFVGEDHTESAWRKRLDIPVTFLLPTK